MSTRYALQFTIQLKGIEPLIWRRVQIFESATFWDLHIALQDVMGWRNSHAHYFDVKHHRGLRIGIGAPDAVAFASWAHYVWDHLKNNLTFYYIYDKHAHWMHRIDYEGSKTVGASIDLPRCLAGENACVPETVGGVLDYQHILNVLAQPDNAQYDECLKKLGRLFDPKVFDANNVVFRHASMCLSVLPGSHR